MSLITISESLGSGGMPIARQVAERLNIHLYDDDRLQKEAVDMGIRAEDFKKITVEKQHRFKVHPDRCSKARSCQNLRDRPFSG